MINEETSLRILRRDFLAGSTESMPIAGIVFWTLAAIGGFLLAPKLLAFAVAAGSGLIFPLAVLIDRLRGRNLMAGGRKNPLTGMFLQSIVMVVLLWPLVILNATQNPTFVVLGAAILMGIIWIPYGWAADDPVGLHHAIARALLCYAAYLFAPREYAASAISVAVLVCYAYSLVRMKRI